MNQGSDSLSNRIMQSTYNKIWKSALSAIQRRNMSRHDLGRKLKQKYPGEDDYISQALDEMTHVELINDNRYTEQLVNHLIQRPIGRFKITMETKKRGLDSDLVQVALMNVGYNEEEMCEKAFEAKDKILQEVDPRKRKQKMMNFLKNRGFTNSVIFSLLNQ